MHISFIGYRHANGEVEGFVGTSLQSPGCARVDAEQGVRNKLHYMNLPGNGFDPARIITHPSVITNDEYATLRRDWGTYRCAGSAILPLLRKGKQDHLTGA